MKEYYNTTYFNWQKDIGSFGGKANLFKFSQFVNPKDSVVDFGSGGGYLLKEIQAQRKIGIEINKDARKKSQENGISTVESAKEIDQNWANVVISNHALEHCERPLDELKNLKRIVKPGGKIVFVLPHERNTSFYPSNISQHLYTWSEVSAGNIFMAAGYKIEKVETIHHTWPPFYQHIEKYFGFTGFNLFSTAYSYINQDIRQIRVIAKR